MRPCKAAPHGERKRNHTCGGEGGDGEEPPESAGATPAMKAMPSLVSERGRSCAVVLARWEEEAEQGEALGVGRRRWGWQAAATAAARWQGVYGRLA